MADILIIAAGEGSLALARKLEPELAGRLKRSVRLVQRDARADAALLKAIAAAPSIVLVLGTGAALAGTPIEAALVNAAGNVPLVTVVAAGGTPERLVPASLRTPSERVVAMAGEEWESAVLQICVLATSRGLPKTATGKITRSKLRPPSAAGIQRNSGFAKGAPPAAEERESRAGAPRAPDSAGGLFSFRTRPVPRMAGPPVAVREEAAPQPEPVLLGASAPRAVRPGDEFTARFVAYLKAAEQEVRATLESLSPRSEHRLGLKSCRWQPGTRVKVTLSGRHLAVSPPAQEFVWEGDRQTVDFDATVLDDAPEGPVVLKFDALVDDIVVAMLRVDLEIARAGRDNRPATASGTAAHTAFASYSSKDRERVLDRVAAVRISAGLDIFLDCLSLHPGEEWKAQLAEQIRERDLFLLFWSREAAQSKWVTWEWETALAQKGKEAIQIQPLETGVTPPEPLKDLHFGDVFMLIREAQRAKPGPAGSGGPPTGGG